MPSWVSLPPEIRRIILLALTCHANTAHLAIVSREWQHVLEEANFRQISVQQSCLDALGQLSPQSKGLVRHLWLNVEFHRYTCRSCHKIGSMTGHYANNRTMVLAITKLFDILADWTVDGRGLTLEISAHSPSDSEHWFQNYSFLDPNEDKDDTDATESGNEPRNAATARAIHDPTHGWEHGHMIKAPTDDALRRIFEPTQLKFPQELPIVSSVTKFLLRRQCRRQLHPSSLSDLWSKLPRLEEIRYEPWQLCESITQYEWDLAYKAMFSELAPASVNTLTIFEDFNEDYLDIFRRSRGRNAWLLNPRGARVPPSGISSIFATLSRQLEHLSVAFLLDAEDFFYACEPHWRWNKLRSLKLTSRVMTKIYKPSVNRMLEAAAICALRMPELETMTLWNGAREEACAFTWSREYATISWHGTWDLELEQFVISAWQKVAYKCSRYELKVNQEPLAGKIRSHGDAIHHLGLRSVVDQMSLRQTREENVCVYPQ